MGEVVFSFAFHGGAGVIPKGSVDSCIYEPSLEAIACKTFAYAETNLSNDNVGAIDVAQFAVQLLENDPLYNAGKGAVLATNGEHELEASIMDGATLQSGAVSMIKNYPSPISLARLVMDKTPHVYMVGEGAEALAAEHGFERVPDNAYFCTEKRLDQLRQAKGAGRVYCDHDLPNKAPSVLDAGTGTENGTAGEATNINSEPSSLPPSPCYSSTNSISSNTVLGDTDTGTVGCVCYYKGSVAAATSTGGMTNKLNGRIGDTPIIGAGTYANNHTCAVSATGKGEYFIRSVCAYDVSARMQYGGASLQQAAQDCVHDGVSRTCVPAGEDARVLNAGSGGVICVDACRTPGAVVMTFNSEGMFRGWGVLRRALLRTSAEEGSAEGSAQGSAGGSEKGSDKGSDKGGELLLQRQAQVGIWQEMKDVCVPVEVAPGTLLREINPKDARSMQRVGQLRFQVWEAESAINAELFPGRCWLDPLDTVGRHWVLEDALTGAWIATARLTLHPTLEDENRDLQLWQRCGKVLPVPTVDLGRLVVLSAYRGRGLAQLLNTTRIAAARAMGARSIVVTASEGNVRLLKKLGFEDIGETVYFEDWPNACFYALQLNL